MKRVFQVALCASIAAATAALTSAQQPQSAPPPFDSMDPDELGWPTGWTSPGSFTRTAAGFMNRNAWRDVVVLAGTHPVLLLDPAFYSVYHDLGVSSNDVDFAKAAGTNGRDAVAVVNSNGLQIVRFDSQFPPDTEVVTKSSNAKWQGAIKVRCGDIDADSDTDYVGLCSSATEVVGWFEGSSTVYAFTRTSTILDIGLGLFDSDSNLDLVLFYADGVEFVQAGSSNFGTTIKSFSHPTATPVTTAMGVVPPKTGSSTDRARAVVVAKYTGPVSPPKALLTYSVPASEALSLSLPTNPTYVSIASGDVDNDGDYDIVLGVQRWFAPTFLRNYASSTPDPTDAVFFTPTSWAEQSIIGDEDIDGDVLRDAVASNNYATPCFASLDGDDYADLLIPLQQTTTILGQSPGCIYLGRAFYGGVPNGPPPIFSEGFIASQTNTDGSRRVYLKIYSSFLTEFTGTEHADPDINGLEVAVWRQENAEALVPTYPEYFRVHPLANLIEEETTIGLGFDMFVDDGCFTSDTDNFLLWVTLTPVYYTGTNPATVQPLMTRPFVGGVAATQEDVCGLVCLGDDLALRMTVPPPLEWGSTSTITGCDEVDCFVEGGGMGQWQAPAIAPRRRIPQMQPGTFPNESTAHQEATAYANTVAY